MTRIWLSTSPHSTPSLWEYGGSCGSSGISTIIADENGKPLTPITIPTYPQPCKYHAEFEVRNGIVVVRAFSNFNTFIVRVYQIEAIDNFIAYCKELINVSLYADVIEVAKQKSMCEYCDGVHYAQGVSSKEPHTFIHTHVYKIK